MKILFVIVTFFSLSAKAQNELSFNKRYVESEDKWVAFQQSKDSSYLYGFIYIDAQAGLTFNYEGTFTINKNGQFISKKNTSASIKSRLQPNKNLVALIPNTKFEELEIKQTPDWLQFYKTDTASIERLYRWGFIYNGYEECAKALTYLERAQKINPLFKGLAVELAFSYNCLSQYNKAIDVLQTALISTPNDAYTNKELVFAQVKSGQLSQAEISYKNAVAICTNKGYNAEMCYNILHQYFEKKDKINFNIWLAEIKKWELNDAAITTNVKIMEAQIEK